MTLERVAATPQGTLLASDLRQAVGEILLKNTEQAATAREGHGTKATRSSPRL